MIYQVHEHGQVNILRGDDIRHEHGDKYKGNEY